jgi:hypothetical protein
VSRDSQRSAVYAWEARAVRTNGMRMDEQVLGSVEDVEAFLKPIWRAERGRYGRARESLPEVHHGHWGQRSALAYSYERRISLPRWARNPWVILHEAAHLLERSRQGHSARFVGILIGLAARHLGHDAVELMALADEMGVRYDVRSIGAVPAAAVAEKLVRLLPCAPMDAAVALGLSYRQVHGAALRLVRARRAAWWRGRLVEVEGPPRPRGL